jgi:hypothetical protein
VELEERLQAANEETDVGLQIPEIPLKERHFIREDR